MEFINKKNSDTFKQNYFYLKASFPLMTKSKMTLVQKQALLPVGKPLQSRFLNREHESGTKGPLL